MESDSKALPDRDRPGRTSEPTVVVYHGEESFDGEQIEPEEQHAEIVQPIKPLITIGSGHMREDVPLSALPREAQEAAARQTTHLAHQTSAGELAASVLQRCQNCVHFDPKGWGRILREAEGSGDKMQLRELNEVRGRLAESLDVQISERHDLDKSGDTDLEHALKALGTCKALTEHFRETVIVYPINPCAMPDFFRPRPDLDARRAAASGYDWILRAAQGKRQ